MVGLKSFLEVVYKKAECTFWNLKKRWTDADGNSIIYLADLKTVLLILLD